MALAHLSSGYILYSREAAAGLAVESATPDIYTGRSVTPAVSSETWRYFVGVWRYLSVLPTSVMLEH